MSKKSATAFSVLLFFLLFFSTLHAQIVAVGDDVFTKCFLNDGELKAEHKSFDGNQIFYFDSKDNIRKFVSDYEYPDSRFLVIAGYNPSGQLSSIIFRVDIPEGTSCHFSAKVNNNDPNEPLFTYELFRYSDLNDSTTTSFCADGPFPAICDDIQLSHYINVNNLKEHANLKDTNIPKSCKKVIFRRPEIGDIAMLNTVNIGTKVLLTDSEENEGEKPCYKFKLKGETLSYEEHNFEDVEVEVSQKHKM